MTLVRKIRVFDAISHFIGLVIAGLCWWSLRPLINPGGVLDQIAFLTLSMGAFVGVGTHIRALLMLALPKSYWDSP